MLSRRRFALISGTLTAGRIPLPGFAAPSAREFMQQVQATLGADGPDSTLDGFKAGDPETLVRGVATTAMATLQVLRQASKDGLNLILTCEPTFYGRQDGLAGIASDDPVYAAKKEFIEKNGLVIWRLHDRWQARKEKDFTVGLADSLGWTPYRLSSYDSVEAAAYEIPPATLEQTVAAIRAKLNLRGGLRSVGDRRSPVRRVMLHPGLMAVATMLNRYSETDLMVAGEVREWECVHFYADLNAAGEKKSLVTVGRVASEEPGMRRCAVWLKSIAGGLSVKWIPAGDPYWRAS